MKAYFSDWNRELSLFKRNILPRLGFPSRSHQQYHLLKNILPNEDFDRLRTTILKNKDLFFRQNSFFRKGAAFDATALKNSPCADIFHQLTHDDFLSQVQKRSKIKHLQYVPSGDNNQISLLHYGDRGDGIDWHYDGNIYLGERWAGILTFIEESHDQHVRSLAVPLLPATF